MLCDFLQNCLFSVVWAVRVLAPTELLECSLSRALHLRCSQPRDSHKHCSGRTGKCTNVKSQAEMGDEEDLWAGLDMNNFDLAYTR